MRVAVATSSNAAALSSDDPILLAALQRAGHEAFHWRGDDARADWASVDVALIRSTWDYFQRAAEFREWLASVQNQTVLVNSAAVLEWNFDKHYLGELATAGLPVVPTEYVRDRSEATAALERIWQTGKSAIIKPVVSGGSWGLHHVQAGQEFELNPVQAPWMVQPFVSEIEEEGELAVIALGGEVHHGIRKRPAKGDFRVQSEFGGINTVEEPDAESRELALAALGACPGATAYARIDMVRRNGRLELMEVELIEPELFLVLVPEAADRLAECL